MKAATSKSLNGAYHQKDTASAFTNKAGQPNTLFEYNG